MNADKRSRLAGFLTWLTYNIVPAIIIGTLTFFWLVAYYFYDKIVITVNSNTYEIEAIERQAFLHPALEKLNAAASFVGGVRIFHAKETYCDLSISSDSIVRQSLDNTSNPPGQYVTLRFLRTSDTNKISFRANTGTFLFAATTGDAPGICFNSQSDIMTLSYDNLISDTEQERILFLYLSDTSVTIDVRGLDSRQNKLGILIGIGILVPFSFMLFAVFWNGLMDNKFRKESKIYRENNQECTTKTQETIDEIEKKLNLLSIATKEIDRQIRSFAPQELDENRALKQVFSGFTNTKNTDDEGIRDFLEKKSRKTKNSSIYENFSAIRSAIATQDSNIKSSKSSSIKKLRAAHDDGFAK